MTTIDPHAAIGLGTVAVAVVGNAIADHRTGTAFYQKGDPANWDLALSDPSPVELADIEPVDIDGWDDIDPDIDMWSDEDLLIADMPEELDHLLYGIHHDDDIDIEGTF